MIKNLLVFSLRNRWIVIAISTVLMAVGYWCFTQLKIEAYPDIADTCVIVVAQYDGRAAEEVEQQVTVPIERALQNTPNVLDRRSRTIFGLSVVQLTFKDGTDDYFARQQVIERLSSASLPDGTVLLPSSSAFKPRVCVSRLCRRDRNCASSAWAKVGSKVASTWPWCTTCPTRTSIF